jgi:hypothetical protein
MAWEPTHEVLNCSAMVDNLMAYFNTNQAEALAWANGGTALLLFKSIADALADPNKPIFPALQFAEDNDATDHSGDGLLQGAYSVMFEGMVRNETAALAIAQGRKYRLAVASMLRNIPDASLIANTGATQVILQSIETGYDPIKTNDTQNDFLQVFQVRATYLVVGAAY